ncbi:MAG: hypothetical protein WA977_08760 [Halobacteriota archaeon]
MAFVTYIFSSLSISGSGKFKSLKQQEKNEAARVNPRCPVVPVSRLDAKNYLAGDEK